MANIVVNSVFSDFFLYLYVWKSFVIFNFWIPLSLVHFVIYHFSSLPSHFLSLQHTHAHTSAKIVNISDLPEDGIEHAFEVIFDDFKILLCTKNEAEKNAWVKTINKCIKVCVCLEG